jgi:polyhydroxyalkanoate synthase
LNFLRTEKWLADRPAHPGGVARQWLNDLYRENKLVRGEFEVVGRRVDLRQVTMPVLNIYTETDHIIPPPMTKALRQHVGSKDYTELAVKGGHIGVFVGGASQQTLRERVKDWLEAR